MNLLLVWMLNGGIEGIKFMSARGEMYVKLSQADPDNPFYGEANFRTIATGFFQMVTHMLGIGFQYSGLRIRETLPFLLVPLLLVYLNRRKLNEHRRLLIILLIFALAAPLFAVLLALLTGHTVSFQVLYTNFSVPFVCLILALIIQITWRNGNLTGRILIAVYCLMMIFSASIVMVTERHHAGGDRNLEADARKMESNYQPGDTLIFATSQEALLRNLYFRNPAIFQKVGDTLRHQDLYLEDIHR